MLEIRLNVFEYLSLCEYNGALPFFPLGSSRYAAYSPRSPYFR